MKTKIIGVRDIARDIKLYQLDALDGAPLPEYLPGAHIDLRLPCGARSYSLVHPYRAAQPYEIAVQRDRDSRGGSRYLFESVSAGHILEVSGMRNNFPLYENADYTVLLAGGIGITPIRCMIDQLEALGRRWELHYGARSRSDAAFYEELSDARPHGKVYWYLDDERNGVPPDISIILAGAPQGAHFYCCGPAPMLAAYRTAMAALPPEQVHFERFRSDGPVHKPGQFAVQLARSGITFNVPEGKSILDMVLDAGIEVNYSCEEGHCGACEVRVIEGRPDHHDVVLTEEEKSSNQKIMICCSGSLSDVLVLDI